MPCTPSSANGVHWHSRNISRVAASVLPFEVLAFSAAFNIACATRDAAPAAGPPLLTSSEKDWTSGARDRLGFYFGRSSLSLKLLIILTLFALI